jgi:hypothetical protein
MRETTTSPTDITVTHVTLLDRLNAADPACRSLAAADAVTEILRLRKVVTSQYADLAESSAAHRGTGGLLVLATGALAGFVTCGAYLWLAGFLHLACR